jgi:hypothetical protein
MKTSFPVLFTLTCFACTSQEAGQTETSALVANTSLARRVEITATPVPLNPSDPTQTAIGAFSYAGGIELRGVDTTRLHGLSDLRVAPDSRLLAITDEGELLDAQIVFDASGHVVGVTNAKLTRLLDLSGQPLENKSRADAEGLAVFPNGDRLVSFERDHHIWLYSADGGPARREVPKPNGPFPSKQGLEALTNYPSTSTDAYLVGSEGGRLWLCQLMSPCRDAPVRALPGDGFRLAAAASYGDSAVALLYRAYDVNRGGRISLRLIDRPMVAGSPVIDELTITAPLTRDNFEGVSVVARSVDVYRFYLISDDNFTQTQHTYLMAFDWKQ